MKLTAGRVFGTLPQEQARNFARYQRLGIVGTQVEAGEIARLTREMAEGATGAKALQTSKSYQVDLEKRLANFKKLILLKMILENYNI